jgi:hypothetical protein
MVKALGADLGQGSWYPRPNVGSSLETEEAAAARVRSRPSRTAKPQLLQSQEILPAPLVRQS